MLLKVALASYTNSLYVCLIFLPWFLENSIKTPLFKTGDPENLGHYRPTSFVLFFKNVRTSYIQPCLEIFYWEQVVI